ncbi:adenylate kinase, partial [Candidatus Micrarchaeota archaeon]|nr:adenylate kinase [Candidatus Micrarchaeota archaeon]
MIIVMGIPGAGKSTVLNESIKNSKEWKIINYGDAMFEIAKKLNLVKHKDEIRKMPISAQRKVQEEVANYLSKVSPKIILDTHCSINTPKGYLPGLPLALLSKLNVEGLVLIDAPIKNILSRRGADKSRIRDMQKKEELEEHVLLNKAFLSAYGMVTGAPIIVIQNEDGK